MKRNSISRQTVIIVTALIMFTATAYAGRHEQPITKTEKKSITEDAYLAYVQVNLSGMADTPYLSFNTQPSQVYADVSNQLSRQNGLFHVHITFVNKNNEVISEDDYYIDNREGHDAIKYD
ncbi:MAG TPA: hypothetical protein VKH37_12785 [Ferruginibacter sp.]|nr:hypothetical protein [Ferruginibacter sp.]